MPQLSKHKCAVCRDREKEIHEDEEREERAAAYRDTYKHTDLSTSNVLVSSSKRRRIDVPVHALNHLDPNRQDVKSGSGSLTALN